MPSPATWRALPCWRLSLWRLAALIGWWPFAAILLAFPAGLPRGRTSFGGVYLIGGRAVAARAAVQPAGHAFPGQPRRRRPRWPAVLIPLGQAAADAPARAHGNPGIALPPHPACWVLPPPCRMHRRSSSSPRYLQCPVCSMPIGGNRLCRGRHHGGLQRGLSGGARLVVPARDDAGRLCALPSATGGSDGQRVSVVWRPHGVAGAGALTATWHQRVRPDGAAARPPNDLGSSN